MDDTSIEFTLTDGSSDYWSFIIENHLPEALERVAGLLKEAVRDQNGCIVTPTATPRKVRFKGQQMAAYRFVFCVTDQLEATTEDVHRPCHPALSGGVTVMENVKLTIGDTVTIAAFDDVPEHLFMIQTLEEDRVTGIAVTGPYAGSYGEPEYSLITGVHDKARQGS